MLLCLLCHFVIEQEVSKPGQVEAHEEAGKQEQGVTSEGGGASEEKSK